MTWTAPHALEVLFSPHHGFVYWTPLVLVAALGLAVLALSRSGVEAAARRRFGFCALVMIAAQVYVAGSVESWTVAGAFGQRRFVATTVLLVAGVAAVLAAVGSRPGRVTLWTALAVSVWWNLGLVAQFGAGLMNRQRLEPARNAYVSFVELPRVLPSLAYRYLFDRASFYEPRATSPGTSAPAPPAGPPEAHPAPGR
jgi:hypothetical protein